MFQFSKNVWYLTLFHNKVLQLNYASILRHFSQFWKIGSYMSKCLTITAVKNFKLSDSTSEILHGTLHGGSFLIIIIASRKQKLWVCICLIACRIVLCPNITWTYYTPCILHNANQGHGCSQSSELSCERLCDWCSKIAQEFSLQILHAYQ